MHRRSLSILAASALSGAVALAAGCSDDSSTTAGTGASGGGGSSATSTSSASSTTSSSGTVPPVPEVVAAFDPSQGQFVEGLDLKGGVAYVGALPTGQVFQVALASPTIAPFGGTPAFMQNGGALVGLTAGPDGAIYAALNVTDPNGPKTGVYRIDPAGGTGALFASDPAMLFCNDLRFDDAGDLFVSDSFSGTIFKVAKGGGAVTAWVSDPLLAPDPTVCGVQTDFHLGVNGFVRKGDAYFAVNTDRASVLKIPVNADGTAGQPEIFVDTDCAALSGADGVALDPTTGELIVAVNYQDKIVRVGDDKKITVLAEGDPLQSPASLAVDPASGDLYVTSAAFAALATDPTKAKPSLARLRLK
jgi:hypothetical protein